MPKGLKETSSPLVVSFGLTESAPNTPTEERIDLQLNALDNEVFVVTGVKMDLEAPDFQAGAGLVRYGSFASLSKQSLNGATGNLDNPSVIATARVQVVTNSPFISTVQENDVDTPTHVEYLDIIATPDFFIQVSGVAQSDEISMEGKLYGYRARADASTYAALVQSELLSS